MTRRIPTVLRTLLIYGYDHASPIYGIQLIPPQRRYPQLDELPAVYAALKADQDKTTQRFEMQPEEYTRSLGMSAPVHVSAAWTSISELFANVAEAALFPSAASPHTEADRAGDRTNLYIAGGVAGTLAVLAAVALAVREKVLRLGWWW